MSEAEKTLPCGHPKAEESEPDGSTWCLICSMFVQAAAIDALVVTSSKDMAAKDGLRGAIAMLSDERDELREALEKIRELAEAKEPALVTPRMGRSVLRDRLASICQIAGGAIGGPA